MSYALPGELGAWPTVQFARRVGVSRGAPTFTRKPASAKAPIQARARAKAIVKATRPQARVLFRKTAEIPGLFRPSFAVVEDYPELLGEYPEQVDLGLSFKSIGRAIGKAAKAVEKKVTRPVAKYVKKHPLVLAPLALAIPGAAGVVAAGAKAAAGGALKFASGAGSLASRLFGKKAGPSAEEVTGGLEPSLSTTGTPGTINTIPSSVLPSTNGSTATAPKADKSIFDIVSAEARRFQQNRLRYQQQAQNVLNTGQDVLNQAGVYAAGAGGAVQGAAEGAERGMYEAGMLETARQAGTQGFPPWVIPVALVAGFALMKGGGSRNW